MKQIIKVHSDSHFHHADFKCFKFFLKSTQTTINLVITCSLSINLLWFTGFAPVLKMQMLHLRTNYILVDISYWYQPLFVLLNYSFLLQAQICCIIKLDILKSIYLKSYCHCSYQGTNNIRVFVQIEVHKQFIHSFIRLLWKHCRNAS